jgi:hypothetical protein
VNMKKKPSCRFDKPDSGTICGPARRERRGNAKQIAATSRFVPSSILK